VNRVQKTLEDMNLKLGDVGSSIMGKASRMILQAIVAGETDPRRLAAFAVDRVQASREQLEAALRGHITDHHRFLLSEHLTQIRHLEQAIERVTAEITRRFTPPSPPEEGGNFSEGSRSGSRDGARLSCPTGFSVLSPNRFELVASRRFAFEHSRHRRALGHWDLSRNRGQHAAISDRGAPGLVGWDRALYHALEYPWRSQEELERRFLGQWLTSRRRTVGDCSMPLKAGEGRRRLGTCPARPAQ
jgi:hypothetical protein